MKPYCDEQYIVGINAACIFSFLAATRYTHDEICVYINAEYNNVLHTYDTKLVVLYDDSAATNDDREYYKTCSLKAGYVCVFLVFLKEEEAFEFRLSGGSTLHIVNSNNLSDLASRLKKARDEDEQSSSH